MSDQLTNMNQDEPVQRDYELENELMQMKMQASFGGQVYFPEDYPIPPDLKFELLQTVYDFEEAYRNCVDDLVPVYERIGNPYFVSAAHLTSEGIDHELRRLRRIMFDNHVIFEHEFDYDRRILYKFLTEELFNIKMENLELKGFYKHFLYEHFYPNLREDLKKQTHVFLNNLFAKKNDVAFSEFNHEIFTGGDWISCEEACEKIDEYISQYDRTLLEQVGEMDVQLLTGRAEIRFDISFKAIRDIQEPIQIQGAARLGFSNVIHDLWLIDSISLPGLQL